MNDSKREITDLDYGNWISLLDEFMIGNCKLTPITSTDGLYDLLDVNDDMNSFIQRGTRECKAMRSIVFTITTHRRFSIVWLVQLGRRGCRWHINIHYCQKGMNIPRNHEIAAEELAEKYAAAHEEKYGRPFLLYEEDVNYKR